ncbi:hypothetical protein L6164_004645 [Bauhinia variegata]|uniref:Uncharacterized protein n=1 Tax=Bauhinia variegata TaxID=167791 RepID=A0ACB9Q7S9_BAUVA|nr:hypothetical protein L6164_004645 [Bauhinia variegata]
MTRPFEAKITIHNKASLSDITQNKIIYTSTSSSTRNQRSFWITRQRKPEASLSHFVYQQDYFHSLMRMEKMECILPEAEMPDHLNKQAVTAESCVDFAQEQWYMQHHKKAVVMIHKTFF